ncbi:DUF4330 family protein [Halovenus sp. WSH3]|uniref:DUF4330 family protein n=1 Tax=Halovenus carboxidivorans TaxID=2692199 RepID=A0A6B0T2E6_9EURY|nr:DUF4330 family protein [Halovenus carboxidivorans]MXR50406.1 DUF4330 family protein [Halovenus carboxidivorans]
MSEADEDGGRELLDDEGRLFGLVNVVDLLVVLLVVAVVVAGAALLLSDSGEADTRQVTMDLGTQPDFVAEQISPGDSFEPEGTNDSVTITDVYRYEGEGGTNVIVRATVRGTTIEPQNSDETPTFQFRGQELQIGQSLALQTSNYSVEGQLTQIQRSGESLPTREAMFTMQTTVPADTADAVAVGDTYEVGGQTIAEITSVQQFPNATNGERTLRIGVSAQAIDRGGLEFGDTPLRVGNTVPFQTDEYQLTGEIRRRGTNTIETAERPFIAQSTVPADVVEDIDVGDEYRFNNETLVRIESAAIYPSNSADQRRVILGLSVLSSEEDGTIVFGDRELRTGQQLPIQTSEYSISATITRRGTNDLNTELRPFVVETNVPASVADDITAGDTYRLGGETVVRVESTTLYTTDQPDQRRAVLGVSALTREDDGTILFGNRELRLGQSLPIQTAEYDITGEIIRRGSTEAPGEPQTRTATLDVRNVRPEIAAAIEEGETEQIGEETLVEVLSKETAPADVILESESGEIFLRQHPRNLDVELDVSLQVRELEDGSVQFRGEPLRTGDTIVLELGQLRVNAQVTSLEE